MAHDATKIFAFKAPDAEKCDRCCRICEAAEKFADAIAHDTEPSKDQDQAFLKVREAMFWAHACICCC